MLTARAIFGGYFVSSGLHHFLQRKTMSQYAQAKGVPAAGAAVLGSGLMIAAGGASILLGRKPKLGAGFVGASLFVAAQPEPWPWRLSAHRGSQALLLH